jgi:hypothetical protein
MNKLFYLNLMAAIPQDRLYNAACVILINSSAEGFSNSTSDIDLMVVVKDSLVTEEWVQFSKNSSLIDVCFMTKELLLTRIDLSKSTPLNAQRIDFLHKVRTAVPLIGDEEWGKIAGGVDWALFDEKLVDLYSFDCVRCMEDAVGSLKEGDYESAGLTCRESIALALDAFLASNGESQPRQKWRLKKARRALGDDSWIIKEYLSLQFCRIFEETEVNDWLDRCLYFIRCMEILTFFRGFPHILLYRRDGSVRHTLLSDRFTVCIRQQGEFIYYCGKPTLRSNASVALIFYLSALSTSIETAISLSAKYSELTGRTLKEGDVRKTISLLSKHGFLKAEL